MTDEASNEALQGGYFVEYVKNKKQPRVKNTLVKYGAQSFLQTVFQALTPLAGTLYLGLTNAAYTFDQAALLTALNAGEPVGNGYARQALIRDNTHWTVSEVNGVMMVQSVIVNFTCTGAPWTQNWLRMFICDAAAGTAGNVVSLSGAAPAPRVVNVGAGPAIQYEYFLRG